MTAIHLLDQGRDIMVGLHQFEPASEIQYLITGKLILSLAIDHILYKYIEPFNNLHV